MCRMMMMLLSVGLQWTNRKIGKTVSLYQRELFKKIPGLGTFCTQSVNEGLSFYINFSSIMHHPWFYHPKYAVCKNVKQTVLCFTWLSANYKKANDEIQQNVVSISTHCTYLLIRLSCCHLQLHCIMHLLHHVLCG
jgi:hypothetical protein